ncbi:MlaA family lipoprotein [Rheinheimera sp. WS51]|uniref:MlaA family lipoprotein n=1 Tax=Rheinheimera sp. WS51 TaxID=3425886 RepID=UPI003D94467C
MARLKHFISSTAILLMLAGCASNSAPERAAEDEIATSSSHSYADKRDPLESFNRDMWDFNYDVLDRYLLRPATVGYMTLVPKPARKGLVNASNNLSEPVNVLNGALQAKPNNTAISAARFLVNSTLGIFGIFDVATKIGLAEQDEDFDQTLAVWGVGDGAYLMLPGLGPNTARGVVGKAGDSLYSPLSLLSMPLSVTKYVISALDSREQLMSMEQMLDESLDPYAFVKESYFQRILFKIYDGNPPKQAEPELDEDAFDDILDDW